MKNYENWEKEREIHVNAYIFRNILKNISVDMDYSVWETYGGDGN